MIAESLVGEPFPMKNWAAIALSLMILVPGIASSQSAIKIGDDYATQLAQSKNITSLGNDLFGDATDLNSGSTNFSVPIIDAGPGNNHLPVRLSLKIKAYDEGFFGAPTFGSGGYDLPVLRGIFPASGPDWVSSIPGDNTRRCAADSSYMAPPEVRGNQNEGTFEAVEYWHGNEMYMPGSGWELIRSARQVQGLQTPTDGKSYYWVTNSRFMFSCLPNTSNGVAGDAFLAVSPAGDQYYFDRVVSGGLIRGVAKSVDASQANAFNESDLTANASSSGTTTLRRKLSLIELTKVVDRFGNWVKYNRDANGDLIGIISNDGREIKIKPPTAENPRTEFSIGTRTWTLEPTGAGFKITRPDTSFWSIDISDGFNRSGLSCQYYSTNPMTGSGSIIFHHPSGAVGEFQFQAVSRGLSYVYYNDLYPSLCSQRPKIFGGAALVSKKITGAGLQPSVWTYSYGPANDCWYTRAGGSIPSDYHPCTAQSPTTRTVEVTGPSGSYDRYIFGNKDSDTEGMLISHEEGASSTSIAKKEQYSWDQLGALGFMIEHAGDSYMSGIRRLPLRNDILVDGVTFTNSVTGRDVFDRPKSERKFNSLGMSKTEDITYSDNLSKWVLGQVSKTLVNNVVVSEMAYDALARPTLFKEFGKTQQVLTYNPDGTLATVSDGRDSAGTDTTIVLSDWKRGIPQKITHPATADQPTPAIDLASIDDNGWIKSVTDENSYVTKYDYDLMGRLKLVDYPDADSTPWVSTLQSFAPSGVARYGLPVGYWIQITDTGQGRKLVHYDALWRPVVEETFDNTTPTTATNTRSMVVKRYDAKGRLIFQSYPLASLGTFTDATLKGVMTVYDALDRVIETKQDSELGVLSTKTEYLSGLQTRVTNARNKQTLTQYMAYDQPTYDWPTVITHPEGAYSYIGRDVFGKPTYIVRRDGAGTTAVRRSYVYDANQQLCKRIEPESGSTISHYDGAGNLDWSASGLPLASLTSCEDTDPRIADHKIVRTYDARNRLKSLSFPDGKGTQFWAYTPDDLPTTVQTYAAYGVGATPVVNTYAYNKRRLLTAETQGITGIETWTVGYRYDANGFVSGILYPSGLLVDYAPNPLGQATKIGTYATAVKYYPNGEVAQFSYGNGINHALTQNVRGLPDRSRDTKGTAIFLDDSYDYDQVGNVSAISDALPGNRGNRTMTYDGLDRLTKTVSPMFGTATYNYDVLDNLIRTTIGGAQARDRYYCYDSSNRLTFVRSGPVCTGAASPAVEALSYDEQGNLSNRNGQTYTFDIGNRMRRGGFASATYDAYGRRFQRISSQSNPLTVRWMYSQSGQLLFERNPYNDNEYIYLGGDPIAQRTHAQTPEPNASFGIVYLHADAVGSPVAKTDVNGSLTERSEYEPFGELLNRPVEDEVGYTGHYTDASSGLVYAQQRYMDPTLGGRFLSVDPVVADSGSGANFNRYWYANNNPYRFTDPDGRAFWDKVASAWNWLGGSYQQDEMNQCFPHGCSQMQYSDMRKSDRLRQDVNNLIGVAGAEVIGAKSLFRTAAVVADEAPALVPAVARASSSAADDAVPVITKAYTRPSGTPTRAQRAFVQNKPCVDCGATDAVQRADHIKPLVVEYYETGTINMQRAKSLDAVQSQCARCSNGQGGRLAQFSKMMREKFGL